MPVAALIAGLAGLAGAGVAAGVARKQQEEKRELQEKQRQQSLQDRAHDENYNSPSAQKNRLLQAGLSPTQFGSVSPTDSSGAVPEYSPSDEGYSNLINATEMGVNSVPQAMQLQMAKELNDAQINNLNSEVAKRGADKRNIELINKKMSATLENEIEQSYLDTMLKRSSLRKDVAIISNLVADGKLKGAQYDCAMQSLKLAEATYDDMVRMAHAQAENAELDGKIKDYQLNFTMPQELAESVTRIKKMTQDINESVSRVRVNNQQVVSMRNSDYREFERLDADIKKIQVEILNIDYQNGLLEFRNKHAQEQYDNEVKRIAAEIEKTGADAELAKKQASWYAFKQVTSTLNDLSNTAVRAYAAYSTAGVSEVLSNGASLFTTTPTVGTTPVTYYGN